MTNDIVPVDIDLHDLVDIQPPTKKEDSEHDRDLKFARDNMIELIQTGQQAAAELLRIADGSQNSLCYERLATLLKSVSEINMEFIEMSRQKRDEQEPKIAPEAQEKPTTVNNILLTGSFAELQLLISQAKKKEIE